MKTTRNSNISVFVTVLSACLLAVSSSAQICAQPAHSLDLSTATFGVKESGKKVRQVTRRLIYHSTSLRPRIEFASLREAAVQIFKENTKALVGRNNVLVVTRLPRAGIRESAGGAAGGNLSKR